MARSPWQGSPRPRSKVPRPMAFRRLAATALLALALPAVAIGAECAGQDMIAALPADERAALERVAQAVPYPQGNLWRATRDGQTVTILGTYHLDDPRHAATVETVTPDLAAATRLLVEAGPDQEAELMEYVGRNTSLILLPDGQSLPDLLPPDDWETLSQAMRARGLPGFMAARFRPWYISVLLAVPPCAMPAATLGDGLDKRLIDIATARGLPVEALEPFDTAFRIFETMPMEAQIGMIRSSLALEPRAEDQMATLAAAYFRQDSRVIWEFLRRVTLDLPGQTPEAVEADFAAMEEALMNGRNRAWIPVIEAAAADGPVFVAFGALHLSGHEGVLALLDRGGWRLERLPLPSP
ncbi:MAG: TraB/GumN family protein [Paracoccaceae bacterium]|nr:MAG: TraB/GumN family protein [Paracoccaceae bacterium]